jgi:transketolase
MNINEIKIFAKQLRLDALELAFKGGKNGAHLGGGLSTVEIFAVLYGGILNIDPKNPKDENRDRLVVSKGHCVIAYYPALYHKGFLTKEDLDSFETDGSAFHAHALRNIGNGIEFSGGSLSLGISFAVGQALACKKKGLTNRVYVIVGDGECDEGLVWESAMAASQYMLNNLTVIVDCNGLQYDGKTADVMNNAPLSERFRAFGFDSCDVDGHDCSQLIEALSKKSDKPICVVAHTVKGKGVSFMENRREWHHHVLTEEQYKQAVEEVTGNDRIE